jgi:hypothetical protein
MPIPPINIAATVFAAFSGEPYSNVLSGRVSVRFVEYVHGYRCAAFITGPYNWSGGVFLSCKKGYTKIRLDQIPNGIRPVVLFLI